MTTIRYDILVKHEICTQGLNWQEDSSWKEGKTKLQMAMITLNVSTDWNYDVGIMLDTIVIIKIKSRVAAIAAIMSFFFIALLL